MSDNERLRSPSERGFREMLVASARGEAPPRGAHARAIAALGVGAVTTGATGLAGAMATVVSKAGPIGKLWLAAKWVGVGAGAALVSVGTAHQVGSPLLSPRPATHVAVLASAAPTSRPHRTAAPAAPEPTELGMGTTPLSESPAMVNAQLAEPDRASDSHGSASVPLAAPASSTAARGGFVPPESRRRERDKEASRVLAQEIAALDSARRALDSAGPDHALVILDGYVRAFSSGELRPEATLLRVEALLRSGQRDAAERLARRFLTDNPTSPHRAKLNRLLEAPVREPSSISRSVPTDVAN